MCKAGAGALVGQVCHGRLARPCGPKVSAPALLDKPAVAQQPWR
jgi:hypothetical protein